MYIPIEDSQVPHKRGPMKPNFYLNIFVILPSLMTACQGLSHTHFPTRCRLLLWRIPFSMLAKKECISHRKTFQNGISDGTQNENSALSISIQFTLRHPLTRGCCFLVMSKHQIEARILLKRQYSIEIIGPGVPSVTPASTEGPLFTSP